MKLELLAAGTRPPAWIAEGVAEFQKRLPHECRLDVTEVAVANRTRQPVVAAAMAEEAGNFRRHLQRGARIVVLDREGANWSTEKLAGRLGNWLQDFPLVQLLIGGPDGLTKELRDAADERWSLSALTFPHYLVRVLVAEQLYCAWSLINNHPYHK